MINLLQLYFVLLLLIFLLHIIVYRIQKKFKLIKDLVWESITDAFTLNSGIIVMLYLAGKVFNIAYFSIIDDYSLYAALLLSGLVVIGGSIDKLFNIKKDKGKDEKNNKAH